jgi:hypothetical protein
MHSTGTLTRSARTWAALALSAASAACVDLGPSLGEFNLDGGPVCNAACYEIDFAIFPEQQNFLRGDSLEIWTLSTKGVNDATWSSSGAAIALVRPDGSLDSAITSVQRRVWVKGVAAGTGTVRANAVGGSVQFSDTSVVFVADSSAISQMLAYGIAPGSPPKVGVAFVVDVVLLDAKGRSFRAMPTGWSVSDTAIVRVTPPTYLQDRTSRYSVMPKHAGNTTLTFSFLDVRKTVDITVVQ